MSTAGWKDVEAGYEETEAGLTNMWENSRRVKEGVRRDDLWG